MGGKAEKQKVSPKKGKLSKKERKRSQAERADRHDLYERSVQDGPSDVSFLLRVWHEAYGHDRTPSHLREDFCGTALLCGEWVRKGRTFTAEGVDLDGECLRWGEERNIKPLGEAASRVRLECEDVRAPASRKADIRCAQNFSYQVFHDRAELHGYFEQVRAGLSDEGIFVLDMFGGTEAFEELEEEREIDDGAFTYVWDQKAFHPATNRLKCAIHFRFGDGSEIRNAFRYDWRLYTVPEIRDLLTEAGFSEVRTYFEEYDDDGDGTGNFARNEEGEACEGWLAYIVALP